MIGSLMYLVNTRPNICYAVSALSQFMCEPKQIHLVVAKHILRYLRGIVGYGLRYASDMNLKLHGYNDSDWARCVIDWNSTSGCFNLGSTMISWCSREQSLVALSSIEAENIAACVGA